MDSVTFDTQQAEIPSNRESVIGFSSAPCDGKDNATCYKSLAANMNRQFHCQVQMLHGEMDIYHPKIKENYLLCVDHIREGVKRNQNRSKYTTTITTGTREAVN